MEVNDVIFDIQGYAGSVNFSEEQPDFSLLDQDSPGFLFMTGQFSNGYAHAQLQNLQYTPHVQPMATMTKEEVPNFNTAFDNPAHQQNLANDLVRNEREVNLLPTAKEHDIEVRDVYVQRRKPNQREYTEQSWNAKERTISIPKIDGHREFYLLVTIRRRQNKDIENCVFAKLDITRHDLQIKIIFANAGTYTVDVYARQGFRDCLVKVFTELSGSSIHDEHIILNTCTLLKQMIFRVQDKPVKICEENPKKRRSTEAVDLRQNSQQYQQQYQPQYQRQQQNQLKSLNFASFSYIRANTAQVISVKGRFEFWEAIKSMYHETHPGEYRGDLPSPNMQTFTNTGEEGPKVFGLLYGKAYYTDFGKWFQYKSSFDIVSS